MTSYKAGDKVRIKVRKGERVPQYCDDNQAFLEKNNYILTIEKIIIANNHYKFEGFDEMWGGSCIERLIDKYKKPIPEPIYSRFEILDL